MIWSPAPLRLPTRGEWSGDCFLCVCEWMHDLRIRWDFDWPISLSSRWAPLGATRSSTSVSSTYALPLQAALDVDCVVKHTRSVGALWRERESEKEYETLLVGSVGIANSRAQLQITFWFLFNQAQAKCSSAQLASPNTTSPPVPPSPYLPLSHPFRYRHRVP